MSPRPAKKPSPSSRFWPVALLLLVPVLALAAVAAFGLHDHHARMHDRARVEGGRFARKAATAWEATLTKPRGETVLLYPPTPVPGPPAPEAADLETALTTNDTDTLRRLSSVATTPPPLTASGLSVRLLAAWHLWKQTGAPEDAQRLATLALYRDPGVLSPKILTSLDEAANDHPPGEIPWLEQWRRQEHRRALASQIPPYRSRTVLRDGDHRRAWLVRNISGDGIAVTLDEELARLYDDVAAELRDDLPWWAGFMINADGRAYGPENARRGEPDYGAADAGEFFRIEVFMNDYPAFTADHARLVYWTWSVVALAAVTALLGLWLVHRTLTKERRLQELKSQFVSSVSHELRAPVGSIRLMAEGLAAGKVTGPAADEFHRLMAGEGARLSSLIENVLDFARIEQGRKEYHPVETDVPSLILDAVKLMTPQAEARGLKLLIETPPLPFVPLVDPGALQQALINLLDNAIKFTPPDTSSGAIRIGLTTDPSRNTWSLSVTDHGIGIPAAEHQRIFERFYRLGNELRRETTGTGIGLAIVKHIVAAHHGSVTVDSTISHGSTFRMEFPHHPAEVISHQSSVISHQSSVISNQ